MWDDWNYDWGWGGDYGNGYDYSTPSYDYSSYDYTPSYSNYDYTPSYDYSSYDYTPSYSNYDYTPSYSSYDYTPSYDYGYGAGILPPMMSSVNYDSFNTTPSGYQNVYNDQGQLVSVEPIGTYEGSAPSYSSGLSIPGPTYEAPSYQTTPYNTNGYQPVYNDAGQLEGYMNSNDPYGPLISQDQLPPTQAVNPYQQTGVELGQATIEQGTPGWQSSGTMGPSRSDLGADYSYTIPSGQTMGPSTSDLGADYSYTTPSGQFVGPASSLGGTAGTNQTGGGGGGFFDSAGQWIKDNPVGATILGVGGVGTILGLSKLFGGGSAGSAGSAGSVATGTPGAGTGTSPVGTGTSSTGVTQTPGNNLPAPQPTNITPTSATPGTTTPGTTTPGTTTPGTTTPGTTSDWSSGLPDWLKAALGVGGAALLAPYISKALNPGTTTNATPPDYLSQFGVTPSTPGAGAGGYSSQFPGFANPGLNPGWIGAGVPSYNQQLATTQPQQNQYNWGSHPYMYQMSDLANYNNPATGPVQPQ